LAIDPSNLQDPHTQESATGNQSTPNQNPVETDQFKNNKTEWFQFIIAMVIIIPFMAYVGIFHAANMTQEAKDILSMLGAFVGTIVGFYFGQRPIQSLTKQIQKESSEKAQFRTGLSETVTTAINKTEILDEYREKVIDLSKNLEEQASKYESMLNEQESVYESILSSLKKRKINKSRRSK